MNKYKSALSSSMIKIEEIPTTRHRNIVRYTLTNRNGMKVAILNYGAIIQQIIFTSPNEKSLPMLLSFDDAEAYFDDAHYLGAAIGRFANRIAWGRYDVEGETVQLQTNASPHQLHGGNKGLHNRFWEVNPLPQSDGVGIELHTVLAAYSSGFPGELSVTIRYELSETNELLLHVKATTSYITPVSITHHPYFTLGQQGHIKDLLLKINAETITPVDSALIPTGDYLPVKGTPFDFTQFKKVGQHLYSDDTQLHYGAGFDHNYVLNTANNPSPTIAASIRNPNHRILMELLTTLPGLQFYSGNHIHTNPLGKFQRHAALCLEPQFFPNAMNTPHFPSCWLHPDQTYDHKTILRFSNY